MIVEYPLLGSKQLKLFRDQWFPLVEQGVLLNQERRQVLDALAGTIQEMNEATPFGGVELVFICTHNSRWSQLAQVWAQCIADDLGLDFLRCHSAGTERTFFHPNAMAALSNRGFVIKSREDEGIEVHDMAWSDSDASIPCFSKTLEDPSLPQHGFIAVTTCNDADQACPVIIGAARRLALPYADPKVSDGTPDALATYARRSDEIALEMLYVLGQVSRD